MGVFSPDEQVVYVNECPYYPCEMITDIISQDKLNREAYEIISEKLKWLKAIYPVKVITEMELYFSINDVI